MSSIITLGLNAVFHDSAAALMCDGRVVAAAEEERFTRIKHGKRPLPFSTWELPFHAIDFCLQQAGITLRDVTQVGYSFDPAAFVADPGLLDRARIEIPLRPGAQGHDPNPAPTWESPWDPLFLSHVLHAPGQLADGAPHHLRRRLSGVTAAAAPYRWHYIAHHTCHQASAFLAAPFAHCAVMTLDGRGERASTTYGHYIDGGYRPLGTVEVPHSLGLLYERITTHLGFLHSSDEYKVMALAALGRPAVYHDRLRQFVRVGEQGQFWIERFDLEAVLGPARGIDEPLVQRHFDITAALQQLLENTVLALAEWLQRATGERQLAMAGGVALNCVMNSKLRDSGVFDTIWIQPAAGDAGTALGAALWLDAQARGTLRTGARGAGQRSAPTPQTTPEAPRWTMEHSYLGPEFSDDEIERQLAWAKLDYLRPTDLAAATAELLARDCVIGWFQGRMEWGPRALGARSILASPIDPGMQARLNELKDREDFRPVAPAVPVERFGEWFTPADANGGRSPFMLFVFDTLPAQAARIPSACHADHTARVQTVDEHTNPRFHALLTAFAERTGVPVLVNTSFNVRGQPVVCTPRDALEAFFSTPLDALVIGSFIVTKRSTAGAAA